MWRMIGQRPAYARTMIRTGGITDCFYSLRIAPVPVKEKTYYDGLLECDRFPQVSKSLTRGYDGRQIVANDIETRPVILNDVGETLPELLHTVCRHLPTDFEPYNKRERNSPDCSYGCLHFLALPEPLQCDWGVCVNLRSPRSGLLTFEHQGCEFFETERIE